MATSKRKNSRGGARPARAMQPAAATISATPQNHTPTPAPTRAPASHEAERAALGRRRLQIGAIAAALFVGGALLIAFALGAGRPVAEVVPEPTIAPDIAAPAVVAPTAAPPTALPTVAAPTAAPPTAAAPTAAPPTALPTVAAPTAAAPAAQAAAPAAPAAPAAQAAAPAVVAPTCVAIAGLPVFDGATCVDYDMDEDDGIIEHQNTYTSGASVDEVRRFYEAAFAANGWTVVEFDQDIEDNTFEYTVAQQLRRVKVKIEPELTPSGVLTEITIDED